jgi:hypothetical protein
LGQIRRSRIGLVLTRLREGTLHSWRLLAPEF